MTCPSSQWLRSELLRLQNPNVMPQGPPPTVVPTPVPTMVPTTASPAGVPQVRQAPAGNPGMPPMARRAKSSPRRRAGWMERGSCNGRRRPFPEDRSTCCWPRTDDPGLPVSGPGNQPGRLCGPPDGHRRFPGVPTGTTGRLDRRPRNGPGAAGALKRSRASRAVTAAPLLPGDGDFANGRPLRGARVIAEADHEDHA